jgi:two-component system, NtrC family, response regulator HydG
MSDQSSASAITGKMFLVIRSGTALGTIYTLQPGQVATVGRAQTNRIVVPDDVCSRTHCEVFSIGGKWFVRDRGSRNGTLVNSHLIKGDVELKTGMSFQIGSTILGFTHDTNFPFSDELGQTARPFDAETAAEMASISDDDDGPATGGETSSSSSSNLPKPEIVTRRKRTRYAGSDENLTSERTRRDLRALYQIVREMGQATTTLRLGEVALAGLQQHTASQIGAILLVPGSGQASSSGIDPASLQVLAFLARDNSTYRRVSKTLSRAVLQSNEAILANDVENDERFPGDKRSMEALCAHSVLCAPIRADGKLYGLIHLYSTTPDQPLVDEDLDLTLAVADQMALGLSAIRQVESLQTGLARVETENQTLRQQLQPAIELIGESAAVQKLRQQISRIAPTDAPVLIRGESGVGKELVARAIHDHHPGRISGPFVTMNCAALSESLLESELFGHEKGAFTGAVSRKIGKFEQANGGTLFLDEVGEMGPSIQAKFLRVLEGHPFDRVGGASPIMVNVRLVAATNRNLEQAVEEGTFRKDLYFRLQVVEIFVAPLRDRLADIPLLAETFLQKSAAKSRGVSMKFHPSAMELLLAHDWSGNVRELRHAIERAVILCGTSELTAADFQLSTLNGGPRSPGPLPTPDEFAPLPLESVEQQHILAMLEWTNWNKSRAAQLLGIERSTLDRKLRRYDVDRPR